MTFTVFRKGNFYAFASGTARRLAIYLDIYSDQIKWDAS